MKINLRGFFQRIFDSIFGYKVEPKKYNFLIVCTGNTCRSPMAVAIMNFMRKVPDFGKIIGNVEGAGWAVTEHSASKMAIMVAHEYECDLSKHNPQQLTQEVIDRADIILAMDSERAQGIRNRYEAKGKVMSMSTFGLSKGLVMDPYGGSLEVYHKTAKQMELLLMRGLENLANNPRDNGI